MKLSDPEPDDTIEDAPRGARVLVVDDDALLGELVASRLEDDGFDVFVALTGQDLFALAHDHTIPTVPFEDLDLILLEVDLPNLSGFQIIEKLREARCATPIILMTASPDPEMKRRAERLGAPLLRKPFSLDEVARTASFVLVARGFESDPPRARSGLHRAVSRRAAE